VNGPQLVDGQTAKGLVVATTRPETMLGDVAVMVNPEDARYAHLIGQQVHLPLCDRTVPVIADDYVDKAFGTGVVKVTPAHDANDYAVGQRHQLPMLGILNLDVTVNDLAPAKYRGLDRFVARKQIVADLESIGLALVADGSTAETARRIKVEQDGEVGADRSAGEAIGGLNQGTVQPAATRLIGDRGVDETIAEHNLAGSEGRSDNLGDELRPAGREQQGLSGWLDDGTRVLEDISHLLAEGRTAGFAQAQHART
jgi:hypothetical protein